MNGGLIATTCSLRLGATYLYSHGGYYTPLCVAWDPRERRDRVVYQALDGANKDRVYTATLADWQSRFVLVNPPAPEPEPDPDPETPERVAGYKSPEWRTCV